MKVTYPPKPARVEVRLENIPPELAAQPQWVVWRYTWRDGDAKWTKVPYQAQAPSQAAKSNTPDTWGTLEHAVSAYKRHEDLDGIGFALSTGGAFVGVDLDHVINSQDGTLEPDAAATVAQFDTYTEISPSGEGLRLIVCGSLSGLKGRRRGPFEVYDSGRYVTITGHILGDVRPIRGVQAELKAWHAKHIARPELGRKVRPSGPAGTPSLPDQDLLDKAFESKAGAAIKALWEGSTNAHGDDHSAADLALVGHLGWWTNYDPDRTDRMFRHSGLMRSKWDERHFADGRTYGQGTLERAFEGLRPGDGYTGPLKPSRNGRIDPPAPPSDNLTKRQLAAEEVPSEILTNDALYIRETFLEELDERHNREDPDYTTGLDLLDRLLGGGNGVGGFREGLHVLGGITGGGKTSMAVHIATTNALEGRPVMYVTLEQSKREIWARVASKLTGVPYSAIKRGTYTEEQHGTEQSAREVLQTSKAWPSVLNLSRNLCVIQAGDALSRVPFDFDELIRTAEALATERRTPPLVIVDYLQRVPAKGIREIRERVGYIAGRLQVGLARGVGCPVLALSSLSRAGYSLGDKSDPGERLAAFKEAGEVEYTAYTATMLYQLPPEKIGPTMQLRPGSSGEFQPMVIDVCKNREGRPDRFAVKWQPKGDHWYGIMGYGGERNTL